MTEFVPDAVVCQRTQEELRLLQLMAVAIHEADDLNAALAAVLRGVCEATGWAFGQAWLPKHDEATLACSPAWYDSGESLEAFRAISQQFVFPIGIGLPGMAWSSQRPVWSDNLALNPKILRGPFAQKAGLKAALAIPVFAGAEVVAVLEFFVFEARSEDQHLTELVSAVAAQLGSMILRKRAEDGLRRSEARYRAVVDSASDAIITMMADGTIQSFNLGAERTFGYAASEVIGQPLTLLMPERFSDQYTNSFRRNLHSPQRRLLGRTHEAVGRRRDGSEFPVELTITEVQQEDDLLFAVILRSITQRKLTEAMLERQAAALRWQAQLLDLAHDAILVRAFATDHILLWNHGAEKLYGWTPAEALGQPGHTLLHTEAAQPLETIIKDLLEHERWEGELTHQKRDGTLIIVASRWAVQRDEQGNPVSVLEINSDITERKRVELERVRLLAAEQEHSKQLRELAALKADFTAMVAHEIESPLNAIRIFADLLAAGQTSAEQQAQMIAAIQDQVKMLTSLIADVRTSAAVERDDFEVRRRPVKVADLLCSAAAFAKTLPGAHPIVVKPADVTVLADAERIGQVLRNLLSNAAKYSADGTPIELRAEVVDSQMRLVVADNGAGIQPTDLQRIFEKFGRGHDQSGRRVTGVGLGLYLSRQIVRAHGADLEVRSRPGAGSIFMFELEVVP